MIKLAKRRLFRIVIPRYPAFNIYSAVARRTTALGPVCVATAVSRISVSVEVLRRAEPSAMFAQPERAACVI